MNVIQLSMLTGQHSDTLLRCDICLSYAVQAVYSVATHIESMALSVADGVSIPLPGQHTAADDISNYCSVHTRPKKWISKIPR